MDELGDVFRLLKEDELQVGTHVCFGSITEEERAANRMAKLGLYIIYIYICYPPPQVPRFGLGSDVL